MSPPLVHLDTSNFRCLADLSLELRPINVFFGANGSGKSTILDTIWFFRDCAINGVEDASANRGHGIGLLWEGAKDGEPLKVTVSTDEAEYTLTVGLSAGRIEPFAGENLHSFASNGELIQRSPGSDKATLYHHQINQHVPVTLREPEKLSLGMYLDFNQYDQEAANLNRALRFVRLYHARSFDFRWLKYKGSDMSYEARLEGWGRNAWSVLRNLHDRRSIDPAYDTIMKYMTESFPDFKGLLLEQTGPTTVYAKFLRAASRKPLYASGASDGHLQMLLLLTALFSEGLARQAVLLFDEPELSLHPHALSVFARAVNEAASWGWDRQVLIATHSPVLLSRFDPAEMLATSLKDGRTEVKRLSDMAELKDLLQEYSTGSLYMAEVIGAQGNPVGVPTGE
jgi:predicted ATPase